MLIRVGMEKYPGNNFTAWALDFPGCVAYGKDEAEALLTLPRKLLEFDYWVRLHTDDPWFELDSMDFHVDETFVVSQTDHQGMEYEVNAFFKDDLRPLGEPEVSQALQIIRWQQDELLAGIEFVGEEELNRIETGQRWSIMGILRQLASAEVHYLQNFGLETSQIPSDTDPISAINHSFEAVIKALSELAGDSRIVDYAQENWSARKLVRRLLWLRRDHIDQIRQLLGII
jgi:uncharacterized damage-inducible protein DinB